MKITFTIDGKPTELVIETDDEFFEEVSKRVSG